MKTGQRTHKTASLWINVPMFLPQGQRHNAREITHVVSKEPKRGLGSALLREVCKEADEDNTVLVLTAAEELRAWYARFGFFTIQDDIGLMARPVTQSLN